MLISHKYKFVTIDIPKTGTKTMRKTFNPFIDFCGKGKDQHMDIIKCKKVFSNIGLPFEDYFKFCIVRNPWGRYVSYCSYIFHRASLCKEAIIDGSIEGFSQIRIRQCKSYGKLLNEASNDKKKLMKIILERMPAQYDFISNEDGLVEMDMIATTENLNEDIKIFCNKVGIKEELKTLHANKSPRPEPTKNYYTQELIDMVAEKESWVIEKLGYNFPE